MNLCLNGRTRPAVFLGVLALGASASALLGTRAGAQESKDLISLQVRVLQTGAPLDADLDLTFEVYTAQSGGTLLWSESQTAVPVRNGILAVKLGAVASLGNVFKSGLGATTDRWVAIKQAGSEIVPRVRLTAVPYAQGSSAADVASSLWNSATGTALLVADIPAAIDGQGLEADGSGQIRIASSAAGNGLTGGGGSALAVNALALINSGTAAINGDRLEIAFVPSFYSRNASSPAQSLDELAAHLRGIDDKFSVLGSGGGGGGSTVDGASVRPGGRITLHSSQPVPTADITGGSATIVYYLPYTSQKIPLYDGSNWVVRDIGASGRSVSLSGTTANKIYDIYAYWDGDSVELERGTSWTNDTTRATGSGGVSRYDGILVKGATGSQDRTRRFLGTVRITGTAWRSEDSQKMRFIWNWENRVPRSSFSRDNTASWAYASTTYVGFNNNDVDWKIEFVQGQDDRTVSAHLQCALLGGSYPGSFTYVGFGLDVNNAVDTTNANGGSALASTTGWDNVAVIYNKRLTEGYHFLQAVHATGGGTTTFGGGYGQSGMRVTVWN